MTKTQISKATTKELVTFYNAHAAKPVKKFVDRKTAEARCLPFATEPKPAPAKAASESTRNSFRPECKIKVADEDRAAKMRETSRRFASLQLIRKGKDTVEKYIKAGGARLDLSKMVDLGIVAVSQ